MAEPVTSPATPSPSPEAATPAAPPAALWKGRVRACPERYPGELFFRLLRDPLAALTAVARRVGPVGSFGLGGRRAILVTEPELIHDILVTHDHGFVKGRALERARRMLGNGLLTSEGAEHRRQRRLMQPAFHRQRIAAYAEVMVRHASSMSSTWRTGETVDLHAAMNELALTIVVETLFGASVAEETAAIREALEVTLRSFRLIVPPGLDFLDELPFPSVQRFRRARARLDATVFRIIDEHRQGKGRPGDLLDLLMRARDDEAGGAAMSDVQLRDEAMTIFLAGHETTANALTWAWYLLSQHPEVEQRWHAELDEVLAGRAPTLDDVPRLAYTRMVLAETMRLYPPAWIIARRNLATWEVGGLRVPPGTIFAMPQAVVHRDPRWFPDPERFDPQRFTPEAERSRPRFAYFPFGGGSRVCIGESFAWMEGVLLLATLGRTWQPMLAADQDIALWPSITLRPRHGMRMRLHRRP